MKTHHQLIGLAMRGPVAPDAAGQRRDVGRVVVVVVDEAQFGQVAHLGGPGVDRVKQAGGGGGRVLGIGRQHQHAGYARGLERVQLFGDAGLAVAHGIAHRDLVAGRAHPLLQGLRLLLGPDLEWRAFGRPDAGVFGRRLGRPHAQDDAVQDQQPKQARDLDHAGITQKLGQKAPHIGGGGRGRGAQVAEQQGRARRLAVAVGRLLGKGGGRFRRHGVFSLTYARYFSRTGHQPRS